jgi:hypothetical protein
MIFRTKYGRYIDKNNIEVSRQDLQTYLEADGTIYETDFNFPNDVAKEKEEQDELEIIEIENQGKKLVLKHRMILKAKLNDKTISIPNEKKVRKLLIPIWQELKEGDFDLSLEDLQAINQQGLHNEIKKEINWLIGKL